MKTFGLVKGRATFTSITSYLFSADIYNTRHIAFPVSGSADFWIYITLCQMHKQRTCQVLLLPACLPVFTWCSYLLDYVIGYLSFNCELMQL